MCVQNGCQGTTHTPQSFHYSPTMSSNVHKNNNKVVRAYCSTIQKSRRCCRLELYGLVTWRIAVADGHSQQLQ